MARSKTIHPNPFHFTEEDEKRIKDACKNAHAYMKVFGQGRQPFMVDVRHYYQLQAEPPIHIKAIKKQRRSQKTKSKQK